MQNNIFQILQKIQNLLSKSVFCGYSSMITHFPYNFIKKEWWFIKLHGCIMSNKAVPFYFIQIFPLLQFAPVTFRPTLLYCQLYIH